MSFPFEYLLICCLYTEFDIWMYLQFLSDTCMHAYRCVCACGVKAINENSEFGNSLTQSISSNVQKTLRISPAVVWWRVADDIDCTCLLEWKSWNILRYICLSWCYRFWKWWTQRYINIIDIHVHVITYHGDVIKWKHFPRNWPFLRGIHRSPVNSPHKGQWRGALMFTLICARINGWVNTPEAGDLRRYRPNYDVIVMFCPSVQKGYCLALWED